MNRRSFTTLGLGAAVGAAGLFRTRVEAAAETYAAATRALPPLKITNVKVIKTCPGGSNYVIVKIETSEPGLVGYGSATYSTRGLATVTAIEEYLANFAKGRVADNIEDMWQTSYVSSYWRNGPVLNCALCGMDQALWDIKGKRAGMPVYQLLGGKCRFAVDTYGHADGRTMEEVAERVQRYIDEGYRHVRIQIGGYGSPHLSTDADFREAGFGLPDDQLMDTGPYLKITPKLFEHIRTACGDEVELLHDIHEVVEPIQAIGLIKELEQYRPFFIEDPFSPENNGWFKILRQQSSCPIAMGELLNNPHEWTELITNRWIDFIRCRINQVGGITPAMKIAALGEWFGVRTAWQGPGNIDPVGHAANCHVDLAIYNFGIQEPSDFPEATHAVFPGTPVIKNGYYQINEVPGIGVDVDEKLAAKYPFPEWPKGTGFRFPIRRHDGTQIRP